MVIFIFHVMVVYKTCNVTAAMGALIGLAFSDDPHLF